MEKEAPFLQETQLLRAPAANPLLLPPPSLGPQLHWGGFRSPPTGKVRWEQLYELLLWGCCGLSPRGARTPAQRPACACLGSVWGCKAGRPGSPGVPCPMYPGVTAQEGLRQRHVAQRGGVRIQQALTPLLGEKGRVIQEGKNEEEPVAPWEISSCAALPQMWWHWLSPVPALAWPDVAVPVPAPLRRGAGEALLSVVPLLRAPEKNTPLLLKGKLLCSVAHFSGCL